MHIIVLSYDSIKPIKQHSLLRYGYNNTLKYTLVANIGYSNTRNADTGYSNTFIADFGYSNTYSDSRKLMTQCGALEFVAPELYHEECTYGPETDMWSWLVYSVHCTH